MSAPGYHGAPVNHVAGWAPVASSAATRVVEVIGITFGLAGVVYLLSYVVSVSNVNDAVLSSILAMVPLGIVGVAIYWIDRWDREPRGVMILAFLWGAGVSTSLSLLGNTAFFEWQYRRTNDIDLSTTLSVSVGAPLIEELTKGLGVLLIFLVFRRVFDGPVDGVVYGALVGGGFAFTENILYFVEAMQFDQLASTFVGRGLMSPFAHVTFTAVTGLLLGMASRHHSKAFAIVGFPLGLLGAMGLHGLWNYSAEPGGNWFYLYLMLQLPILAIFVGICVYLRAQEAKMIRRRAGEYASAGWLSPNEAYMLGSFRERSRARIWARGYGREAAMKELQKDATRLAYNRERAASGRVHVFDYPEQTRLLDRVTRHRGYLYGGIGA